MENQLPTSYYHLLNKYIRNSRTENTLLPVNNFQMIGSELTFSP